MESRGSWFDSGQWIFCLIRGNVDAADSFDHWPTRLDFRQFWGQNPCFEAGNEPGFSGPNRA
jgi:hypothetical protein